MKKVIGIIKFMLPTVALLALCLGQAIAQDPGGPGGPPDGVLVPIDGGLSLLLAAGAAYGAKKIHNNRAKKRQQQTEE